MGQQAQAKARRPQQEQLPGEPHESEGGNIYVGDYLADTLTAKSLDLPPGAAQVGHSALE